LPEPRTASGGFNLGRLAGNVSTYAILIAFLLIFLLPFIWIWSSAFKTSQEIGRNPFALPTELRWGNLVEAWTVGHFSEYMLNSAIYCAAIVAGSVALACLAGYGLSMLPLPGRDSVLVLFLLRREGETVRAHLRAELHSGLLSERELYVLGTVTGRWGASWNALAHGGLGAWIARGHFHQTATELAFHRRRVAQAIAGAGDPAREADYLARLWQLRTQAGI
jgi:hypothetical protein